MGPGNGARAIGQSYAEKARRSQITESTGAWSQHCAENITAHLTESNLITSTFSQFNTQEFHFIPGIAAKRTFNHAVDTHTLQE